MVANMKDLLEKLSPYNIFNYLLPGVVFAVFVDAYTGYAIIQKDIILGAFLYYFIGLVISRIGSLILEPLLKRIYFVRFSEYSDFVAASRVDPKLEVLSEANNMYRTLSALFLLLCTIKAYEKLSIAFPVVGHWGNRVLVASLLMMFLFGYRKQAQYISRRVEATKQKG
jgi:hypothetical protein